MKWSAYNVISGEYVDCEGVVEFYTSTLVPVPDMVEQSDAEDTQTEQGYIPPEMQIRDQLRAGIMTDAAKRARFDSDLYPDGTLDEDIALDPYREMGRDMVENVRQAMLVGSRLREQDQLAKKAQAEAEEARRAATLDELSGKLVGKSAQEIDSLLKAAKLS